MVAIGPGDSSASGAGCTGYETTLGTPEKRSSLRGSVSARRQPSSRTKVPLIDLLELSDVIPNATHITVPRTRRHLATPPGVRIHTTTKPFGPLDVIERDGIRLTSAARTILDAAEAGTAPEQIELAVKQALARGLMTERLLREGADSRSGRVQQLVLGALR